MVRRMILCAAFAGIWAGGAAAQDALPPLDLPHDAPAHHKVRKQARPPASSNAPVRNVWSDLVHGSPDQQALERADNDRAHPPPIDPHKNDFFSDWRGIK